MSIRPVEPSISFGLIAWLEKTRISLPLKGVECRFDITAGIASVEVDQIFHQSHSAALDCTYTFPLPAEAAVFRCEMHVNDRVIVARVEERGEAKRIFAEQKAAGHRAAMVEVERENLFTLSLGNAQPGDVIVIRLAYFQTLERAGDSLAIRIPVCPGVRYIPGQPLLRSLSGRGTADDTDQVPDASRISPPRMDALHPDAAYFSVEGRIARSDVAEGSLSSPSHPVLLHAGAERCDIALAQHGSAPDRDFVLRWGEPEERALQPRGWVAESGGERYALVQLRAPKHAPVVADLPRDYYFLVDRSGSMQGAKWTKTCEALIAFVKLLGARDRVWITLFESTFQDFAEAPLEAGTLLRDPAFLRLEKLGVAGGTELAPAAEHALKKIREHSTGAPAAIILITDGQVGNERGILARFRQEPDVTLHAFGIDTAVNDAFLKGLARQQNGKCWLQTPDDDIAGTITRLADTLRRPVITDVTIEGAWTPPTAGLPSLHAGETREISLRLESGAGQLLKITGRLANGARHTFTITLVPSDNPALPLLWARERIGALIADGKKADAIALAKSHNIVCEGAAFIAWDETEKVVIAKQEIYQPCMEVHAMPSPPAGATMRYCMAPPRAAGCVAPSWSVSEHPMLLTQRVAGNSRKKTLAKEIGARLEAAGVEHELAAALEVWGSAKWLKKTKRREALAKLMERLDQSGGSADRRIQLCREFIEHLAEEDTMKSILLEILERWRTTAGV